MPHTLGFVNLTLEGRKKLRFQLQKYDLYFYRRTQDNWYQLNSFSKHDKIMLLLSSATDVVWIDLLYVRNQVKGPVANCIVCVVLKSTFFASQSLLTEVILFYEITTV